MVSGYDSGSDEQESGSVAEIESGEGALGPSNARRGSIRDARGHSLTDQGGDALDDDEEGSDAPSASSSTHISAGSQLGGKGKAPAMDERQPRSQTRGADSQGDGPIGGDARGLKRKANANNATDADDSASAKKRSRMEE